MRHKRSPEEVALIEKAMVRHLGDKIDVLGVTEYGGEVMLWYHHGHCQSTKIIKMRKIGKEEEKS